MTDSRAKAIDDLDRLLVAHDELAELLVVVRGRYLNARDSLRAGDSIETALSKAKAAQTRELVTAALDEFEKCRHVSRLSLIAGGLGEGMSINAISKSWGVSRQLISRLVALIPKDGEQ
ncbi:MAG: hypothetical protein ABSC41_14465 [Acidimicrobiales bacterium]|jgi:hypothetical protein